MGPPWTKGQVRKWNDVTTSEMESNAYGRGAETHFLQNEVLCGSLGR